MDLMGISMLFFGGRFGKTILEEQSPKEEGLDSVITGFWDVQTTSFEIL